MSTAAIVVCCSKAGLAVIRSLGAKGVPLVGLGYGHGQIGLASRHLRASFTCPDPHEDESAFVDFLASLAGRWPGAVIFPSDDASLVATSRHRERLAAAGFRIVAEDWPMVRTLIEKHRTYEVAERAGVPYPRLHLVRDAGETRRFAREIGFPCLLKPSTGHLFFRKLGRKMLMVGSPQELERYLELGRDYGGELMLCEFIPGGDACGANYNSFAAGGRVLREFTAAKLRLKPTLIGFPTAVESRWIPEVAESGRRMIAALGYEGFSCMEFKRDARDGRYKLMEVNGRHNFSGRLAVACGLDFPWMSYLAAQGLPLPAVGAPAKEGVCWIDEERDPRSGLLAAREGWRAAGDWLDSYRRARAFAVFASTDPGPSLRMLADRQTAGGRAAARGRSVPGPGGASLRKA